MELRELTCNRCGAPIAGDDLSWELGLARCAHCGTVFGLQKSDPPSVATVAGRSGTERGPVPLPERMRVYEEGGKLLLTYSWFTPTLFFMLFFAILWNGFMIFWHGISLASGAIFMSLFGLLHTAIGIGIAYYRWPDFSITRPSQ